MHDSMNNTWFFRLSSLAFVCLATPVIAVNMRGVLGFFLIMALAILAATIEGSFFWAIGKLHAFMRREKLIFFVLGFYFAGLVTNLYYYTDVSSTWRLMMSPLVFFIGLCYSLLFTNDNVSSRSFQVFLLAALGIQSIYTCRAILTDLNVIREMVVQTEVGWVLGDQSGFAMFSMLLPIFVGLALRESGALRMILLGCCVLLFVSTAISTFATPLGLVVIGVGIIVTLSTFFPLTRFGYRFAIIAGFVLIGTVSIGFWITRDNPLLAPAYMRLINVTEDPTSGGYSGKAADEGSRWMLAKISISSFADAPIWGKARGAISLSRYVGGHSSFFDSLGGYGLLGGGGALCLLIFLMLRRSIGRFLSERNWESLLALTSVLLLVVGGVVNPYWNGWQPVYVLLLARPFLERTRRS